MFGVASHSKQNQKRIEITQKAGQSTWGRQVMAVYHSSTPAAPGKENENEYEARVSRRRLGGFLWMVSTQCELIVLLPSSASSHY